jgi:hypothetical protein
MNVLTSLLREQPELVDGLTAEVTPQGTVTGVQAVGLLRELRSEIWRDVVESTSLLDQLEFAYLRVLEPRRWDAAVSSARGYAPASVEEWVTFVAGGWPDRGVTLPEDIGADARVSMFLQEDGRTGAFGWALAEGAGSARLSTPPGPGHCGLPDDGTCGPGRCGNCIFRVREEGEWGAVCWCDCMS